MAAPGVNIANSNPVVPEGEFWHHPIHIHRHRYQGVYNNGDDAFYGSVISADTKFWRRGSGTGFLQTFAEINSGIAINSNIVASNIPIPAADCATHSLHTKRIYDVSVNWDEADSINFLSPSNKDAYFLWNEFPQTLPSTTSSRFQYIGGILVKTYEDFDWFNFHTGSQVYPTYHLGYNHGDSKKGMIFTTASSLDNINYWNDPASTGDYTEQFVQGLNRNYGFWLTASKVGTGIIDITSSFGYVNEYYHADQPYGATEGLDDIYIASIQRAATPSFVSAPAGGFTQQTYYSSSVFTDIRGWDITGSQGGHTFYHDAFTQDTVMWKGVTQDDRLATAPFSHSLLGLEFSREYADAWTGSDTTRYFNNAVIENGPERKIRGFSSTKYDYWFKFVGTQPVMVKRPTCECTEFLDFFNVPYQSVKSVSKPLRSLDYYKLTFTDGYTFTAGGLLRLFTFNPLQASATQSLLGYPNSSQWPHSLTTRTPVELFNSSSDFINANDVGFIKCADLIPGTTQLSGYTTLASIEKFDVPELSSSLRPYYWNENLGEKHFDINATPLCPTSSTTHHDFFPHMTRVHTNMGEFTSSAEKSHIDGVIMIENGLYVGFESHRHITFDTISAAPNTACSGAPNGSASILTLNGGIPPYTYSWNTGDTGSTITGLSEGFYTASVTDTNGYFNYVIIEVEAQQPAVSASMAIRAPHTNANPLVPYYRANIAVSMSPQSGCPPFTYSYEMGYNSGPTPPLWEALCTQSYDDYLINGNTCGNNSPFNYPQSDLWTGSLNNYATKNVIDGIRLHTNPYSNMIRVTVTDSNANTYQVSGAWAISGAGGADVFVNAANVNGCTQSTAANYNFFANIDDGTC